MQKDRDDRVQMMNGKLADQSTIIELQNKMRQTQDSVNEALMKAADPKTPTELPSLGFDYKPAAYYHRTR